MSNKSTRYHLLDHIRGICIIFVVIYHLLYDLSVVLGGNFTFFNSTAMNVTRDILVGILIGLVGVSCNLTRSNLKRGVRTLLCGALISVVMLVVMPNQMIVFGILHLMGTGMIICGLTRKFLEKVPTIVGFFVSMLLFVLTIGIRSGYFGLPNVFEVPVPNFPDNMLMVILGFNKSYAFADYWPIMPWMFLIFAGNFIGRVFKKGKVPLWFCSNFVPPISFIGRHTLIIYLVHQPLILGLMMFMGG